MFGRIWRTPTRPSAVSGYPRARKLGDYTLTPRTLLISLLALALGGASACIALLLLRLIGLITNLAFYQRWDFSLVSPVNTSLGLLVLLVPVVGSFLVGLLARYGSERIRGHGIPEALEAILMNGSRVEPKVALLKPLASAIAIGTGGPFGAEGPIIMTGGAFGSMVAQFFHLTSAERKTLLVAGAAGGMAAIFNTPIAATLLAVELMLFEWKPRSLIPVSLACVAATVVRSYLPGLGPDALFATPLHAPVWSIAPLLACVLVGVLAGVLAVLLTQAIYASEDLFHKLPIHWMWWPLLGGIVIGIGGFIYPPALGVGYDLIHQMLLGHMTMQLILGLLLVKSIIWVVSLSSGTSGGVLAPLLLIGGALGGLESLFLPQVFPGFWPLMSMTAVLGATIGCPLTVVVFSVELTRDVSVLPPLLLTTIVAYSLSSLVLRRSILTEKISRRGYHLSREYSIDPLEILFVSEVMRSSVLALNSAMSRTELYHFLHKTGVPTEEETEELHQRQHLFPVLDEQQHLLGVVTRHDLEGLFPWNEPHTAPSTAAADRALPSPLLSVMHAHPLVAYPDEPLRTVVYRMAEFGYTRFPVVDRAHPEQLVGMVSLQNLLQGRVRYLNEERRRERMLQVRLLPPFRSTAEEPERELLPR